MIAALYVQRNGCYWSLPGVDPWDEERDARLYDGPHPVVAHPPCARWCQLARLVEVRNGISVGDDGGCFASALEALVRFGGVLEHPALSLAWARFGLPKPEVGGWTRGLFSDIWTTEVYQSEYGHSAPKRTWLAYVGGQHPPPLRWTVPQQTITCVEKMSKRQRNATPIAFRDALLQLARMSVG